MKPVLFLLLRWRLPALAQIRGPLGTPVDPSLRWIRLSMAGIARANGKVDSVFIDRPRPAHVISGGDWVSYMCSPARRPADSRLDRHPGGGGQPAILVDGRMVDLPPETRVLFGPLMMLVDP